MSIFNLKCIADLVLYFLTSALFIIGVFFLVRAKEGLLK